MIDINLIRQYIFCPRIVYFHLFSNIKPAFPRHVKFGIQYHDKQNKLLTHRKFKKLKIDYLKIISDCYMYDENLDIKGIVDIGFISKDEVVACEYKYIKKPELSHYLQVTGYALLMEKEFNLPAKRGFVIYGKNLKFQPINIQKHKKTFFNVLDKIKFIEKNEIFPDSSASDNKCSQCEYINFCDDRF